MFAYCGNNPVNFIDPQGLCRYDAVTGQMCDCGRRDCPSSKNYLPFTASMGICFAIGIGPLSVSIQIGVVTDSAGTSELQMSYSAPSIFSTSLPSTDEMLKDIAADDSSYRFGMSIAGYMSFTNAPKVDNLYGQTYSVGVSVPGVAIDYNAIPDGENPGNTYSGITISSGMITPGFNVSMSNTTRGFSVPFSVFDLAESAYNGIYGR